MTRPDSKETVTVRCDGCDKEFEAPPPVKGEFWWPVCSPQCANKVVLNLNRYGGGFATYKITDEPGS